MIQGVHGRIVIKNDTHTGENLRSRQTLCASLLHPTSGLPIVEVPSMYDVHLLSLTGDELIVGFEAQWNGYGKLSITVLMASSTLCGVG